MAVGGGAYVYVLTNPPGRGVGLPFGVYSSLERAREAARVFGEECRVLEVVLDGVAGYAAAEPVWVSGGSI